MGLSSLLARRLPVPSSWIGKKSEFEAAGESGDVYWIPEQKMNAPGKTTVFNRIRLSEHLRRDFSIDVVEYIFLHERGHAERGWVGRIKYVSMTFVSLLLTILSLLFAIVLAGIVVANISLVEAGTVGFFFGLSIWFGWLYCRVQRNEELRAECYALNSLGEKEFRRRRNMWEKERKGQRGTFARLQRRYFYPEEDTIFSTYDEERA
jgi:Zn-dependent protease with chaperone function